MKRLIIILCLVAGCVSASYSQKWNHIGDTFKKTVSYKSNGTITTFNCEHKYYVYDTLSYYMCLYEDTTDASTYRRREDLLEPIPSTWVYLWRRKETNIFISDTIFKTYTVEIPNHIIKRYALGDNLMKAGWIHFGVGLGVTAVGGIVYGCGLKQTNPSNMANMTKAGAITMGVGGTLVSVSLPMLWFGDNIKRESNVHWKTYDILK